MKYTMLLRTDDMYDKQDIVVEADRLDEAIAKAEEETGYELESIQSLIAVEEGLSYLCIWKGK